MNQTRMKPSSPPITDIPRIWWKTISDIRIYRSLIHTSRFFAFTYTFLLYAVIALVSTVVFQFRTLPEWQATAQSTWEELQANWPEDAEIAYENGTLTFQNFPSDFFVSYPEAFTPPESFPKNIALIQTTIPAQELPLNEISESALFALTNDRLLVQPHTLDAVTEANSSTWNELLGAQSGTITKQDLETYQGEVQNFLATSLQWLIIPHFLLAWIGLFVVRIALLALYTFVAQTLFWFFGTKIRYAPTYQLGLYTLPVVELLPLLWKAVYGSVIWTGSFWWMWLLFLTLLAWDNRRGKILEL